MRDRSKFGLVAAAMGVMIMAIPASASAAKPKMLSGTWGGDRMNLTMGPSGGEIRMDCATGAIKGRVIVDAKGRFTARGTFDQERGGPIRAEDFAARGRPALFRGQMTGDMMKLSITRAGSTTAETYTLHRGHSQKLVRCL